MSLLALPFPNIDPVIFEIGPLAIRWYSLAYIAGLMLGWRYMLHQSEKPPQAATREDVDDFLVWATLGVVLGGRLGYVIFYNFSFYLQNPLAALQVWQGGMSFHGGVLGVVAAGWLFVRKRSIPALRFADMIAGAAPIGLFFGRIANFINGELFGRVSDVPWAMVFPRGGLSPRHPSQLYEAALEGALLFVVLWALSRNETVRNRPGIITGVFLAGYALARASIEMFRQPDAHLGFLAAGLTMGQWLSLPMLLGGVYLIIRARRPAKG
ncbi:MAG: prolipoprotein diacylglyceryl transferase [Rhodospirillaceae bacterium]|nr:prolipoprotein diacylglyceryl transferase [Rhodospirillaceae bacterium]